MSITISLVQQTATSSSTPSTARTLNGVAQGNLLVMQFASGATNIAEVSVTDNNGNLWQIAESISTANETVGIAYASNVNAGNTTVTITNSINQPVSANLAEYNQTGVPGGILTLDQVNAATGNSTSPNSGNVTTTSANEVLIGMIYAVADTLTVGAGWTGNTNFLTTIFPEYQIATTTGTFAATATAASGIWASVVATFLIYIPPFNTIAGRFNSSNVLVGNLLIPNWHGVVVTPVTINTATTADQSLMNYIIPANTLNSIGRTLEVHLAGVYSTPICGSAITLTFKIKLGSLTLINIVSSAADFGGGVTNNKWLMDSWLTVQTAGSSAAFEASGQLLIDLGALNSSADTIFPDNNTNTIGTLDTTVNQTIQVTVAFSQNSSSNSCTQRQMILNTVS